MKQHEIIPNRKTNAIKVVHIGKYVDNIATRERTLMSFKPTGEVTCEVNGVEIPYEEFDKLYPITLAGPQPLGPNPDGTKAWRR